MRKLYFVLSCAFLCSCATDPAKNKTKTSDTSTQPVKAISVTAPVAPVPKQVSDSIWNGDYIERYPNGVVKKRGYISGGLASGEWLTFYEDGKEWSKGQYKNGVRIGHGVSWHHNGQKSSEGEYRDGNPVGVWKYWSEQGQETVKDYGGM